MQMLHRKLLRDLWILRGPVIAIGLVMASGVATFVMSLSTLSTLYRAQNTYYERFRFADGFVRVKLAPVTLAQRLAETPGIQRLETRIIQYVNLDIPNMDEPATGQLISIPNHAEPSISGLFLRVGRWPELDRPREVLVSDGFATAHKLRPGDRIGAILNGRWQLLEIVGVALSPEFIYQIREGDMLPDDKRFGIFWMRRRSLEAAYRMEGAFNQASFILAPGINLAAVIEDIDRQTAPYGATGAYGRKEQSSHKFVSNELNELRGMAMVIPTIFLLVSAWLLQVVMSRLIGTQREQIATLKAFGFTSREIGLHYLQLALVTVWLGTAVGIAVGTWLGRGVAAMYSRFFHFPVLEFQLDARVAIAAVAVSTAAAVVAIVWPIWKAMRLAPAEAMRPELPQTYGTSWLESLGFWKYAPTDVRMIARQMLRRPVRTIATCLGIAMALSIVILGRFMLDGLNYVMETEFNVAQRQDVTVTFLEPTSGRVLNDVRHLPGVLAAEAFRAVPARIRVGHRSRRLAVMGLPENGRLYRVVDVHRNVLPLPGKGVVLSKSLADFLKVRPGESVTMETLEGRRPVADMLVAGVVEDFQGESAYAQIEVVHRLMQEENAATGAFLSVDRRHAQELYRKLKEMPQVAGVTLTGAALTSLKETIVANIARMRAFNIGFACVIACGVVYNSARITLAERSRELATLRIVGFTRGEITRILLGELAFVTLLAIPVGILIGHLLADFVIRTAYNTELFRIPLVVTRQTDAFAALVTLLATAVTGLLVALRLARLDLVAVLKTRE